MARQRSSICIDGKCVLVSKKDAMQALKTLKKPVAAKKKVTKKTTKKVAKKKATKKSRCDDSSDCDDCDDDSCCDCPNCCSDSCSDTDDCCDCSESESEDEEYSLAELKKVCGLLGLPVSGTKATLAARIADSMR